MEIIPLPNPGELVLLTAPKQYLKQALPACIAGMAANNPLHLMDGGNRLNLYGITREIRRISCRVQETLENITIQRAFTCYQVLTLLADIAAARKPLLVLDLLVTFYDENVSMAERLKLLDECSIHLQRLSETNAVLITHTPVQQDEDVFLKKLEDTVGNTWRMEPLPSGPQMPRLL